MFAIYEKKTILNSIKERALFKECNYSLIYEIKFSEIYQIVFIK